MENQPQAYIQLRGAVFAELGFNACLADILPGGRLQRQQNVQFVALDERDKPTLMEKILGCEGTGDPGLIVALRPYRNREKARAYLAVMCVNLGKAYAGDRRAREYFAAAWGGMILACGLETSNNKTQIDLLASLYGRGRLYDALNRTGGVADLAKIDPATMLDEVWGAH